MMNGDAGLTILATTTGFAAELAFTSSNK